VDITNKQITSFFKNIKKNDNHCWEWQRQIKIGGYGAMRIGTKTTRRMCQAHRICWQIHNGSIPEGLLVLHKCDNRICCNPDHLFLGNQKDNMDDMYKKGRDNNSIKNPEFHAYMLERSKSPESKEKIKQTHLAIKFQKGENNSQFGTLWIYHSVNFEQKKIKKEDLYFYTSNGWEKGRKPVQVKIKKIRINKGICTHISDEIILNAWNETINPSLRKVSIILKINHNTLWKRLKQIKNSGFGASTTRVN
jgi:hypothetical protein